MNNDLHGVSEEFRAAMTASGIVTADPIHGDGKLHRFYVDGDKRGSANGWYVLFTDGPVPTGCYGSHKLGTGTLKWNGKSTRVLTPQDRERMQRRVLEITRVAEEEKAKVAVNAKNRASELWTSAAICESHSYLDRKGVKPFGLRVHEDGRLIIPIRDIDGNIHSLQFIAPTETSDKRYLAGGVKAGNFHLIGNLNADLILVAEGYATGASIHMATGLPTVVAFDSSNLVKVATTFRGRYPNLKIIICGDDDRRSDKNPGRKAANAAAFACGGLAVFPVFVEPSSNFTDFNDLHAQQGLDCVKQQVEVALKQSIENPAIEGASSDPSDVRIYTLAELLALELPPLERVIGPFNKRSLNMVHAYRGVGKTFICLNLAHAIARGGSYLQWERGKQPRKVLYIDGEMPATALQSRIAAIELNAEEDVPDGYFRFVVGDLHEGALPDLASEQGQAKYLSLIGDAEVIIFDNLSCLVRSGRSENEAESWIPVQGFLLQLRRQDKTVLLVHHSGKNGNQRGTSKREDNLDTVISLRRPLDYTAEDGARFEVHYEKTRNSSGGEILAPFEAWLKEDDNGNERWEFKSVLEDKYSQVVQLYNDGMKQSEIVEELGISKGHVSKLVSKGKREGLITSASPSPK